MPDIIKKSIVSILTFFGAIKELEPREVETRIQGDQVHYRRAGDTHWTKKKEASHD